MSNASPARQDRLAQLPHACGWRHHHLWTYWLWGRILIYDIRAPAKVAAAAPATKCSSQKSKVGNSSVQHELTLSHKYEGTYVKLCWAS